jgi:predicted protein tyrosine phosphatase
MNKIIDIEVLPKSKAKEFSSDNPWAAISVSSDPYQFADLQTENRAGLLQLCFLDRNFEDPSNFSAVQANQIIDFVFFTLPKIESLLIHCEAGVSRSPAIAAAVSVMLWGANTDRLYFKNYTPNTFVYNKLLETYHSRVNGD